MKKHAMVMAVIAATVALSACSKSNTPDPATTAAETTAAVTEAAVTVVETTATAESTEESTEDPAEEVPEDYSAGTIVKLEGNILTIMDDFDEVDKTYDISDAAIIKMFPLTVGDYVEITFPEGAEGDIVEALQVEVLDSVMAESEEPIVVGTIEDATANTLTIETEDGETYTFGTANAYKVSGDDGFVIGDEVQVTYLGTLGEDDALMATKIVTEDKYDSPEAKIKAFIGDVDSSTTNSIVLVAESGDYFSFASDKLNFSSYKEGTTVQITYEGTLSAKEIPATAIEAK